MVATTSPFLFLLSSGGRDGGGGEGKIEKRKMVKASRFFNRCDKFFKRWVCVKTLLKVLDWFKKKEKKSKEELFFKPFFSTCP